MKIKLNKKLSKHKAKIFVLCNFNIKNMTYLFIGLFLAEQGISVFIETVLTGNSFNHWFDSVFSMIMASAYFYYINELGEFLLYLHLNAKVDESA